ncbi:MAG: transposase [Candidatus Eisenbacteria bacterium]
MKTTSKTQDISTQACQRTTERLVWFTARKDQEGIAQGIADGKDLEEVYGLGDAALFDEFFCFLDEFKISDLFAKLKPNSSKRSSNVSFHAVLLIYLMRIVCGLPFFWDIKSVILQSQSLMRLVGFNGRQVRKGTSARGTQKSKSSSPKAADDESQDKDDTIPIRGPLCPQSIGKYVSAILAFALERFFNGVISILASRSLFSKRVHALLDASEIQTTQRCEGCGKVKKEKAPELRRRKGRIRKVAEMVFGFKIWVVWDANSKLPLALRFATINVADTVLAQKVVEQAIANLGEHATIKSLAFDRGFLDGKFMWWLDQSGIVFQMPAKTNLAVYKDALSLVGTGTRKVRERKRYLGRGKTRRTVIDTWEMEGLEGLTSAGFYGELGSGSHENRKDFVPNPLNAVVVLNDPFKVNNPTADTMVILTNGDVKKNPLRTYDGYDERSEIENSMFREGKQAWFLERPAENTEASFRAHVYLTIATIALTTAFRTWMDAEEEKENQGKETGIRKFRERIRLENGNKLIVFEEDRYAIFDAFEVIILCGRNVRKPRGTKEKITKEDILASYRADKD